MKAVHWTLHITIERCFSISKPFSKVTILKSHVFNQNGKQNFLLRSKNDIIYEYGIQTSTYFSLHTPLGEHETWKQSSTCTRKIEEIAINGITSGNILYFASLILFYLTIFNFETARYIQDTIFVTIVSEIFLDNILLNCNHIFRCTVIKLHEIL